MVKLFPFLLDTNFPFLMPFIPYASYFKKVCETLENLVGNFGFFPFNWAMASTTGRINEGVVILPSNGPPKRTGPSVSVSKFVEGMRLITSLSPLDNARMVVFIT